MSSKLFAFQVAKPIEPGVHERLYAEYDSESQTLIWQGGRPLAVAGRGVWCTGGSYTNSARQYCNAYGDYCTTWGALTAPWPSYNCDGF